MRDPKRIPKVLKNLQTIWECYPDWRLGQLVCNIGRWKGYFDPFFMEDDVIEKYLAAMTNGEEPDQAVVKAIEMKANPLQK